MPRTSSAKDRIRAAAATLLRRRGYTATGLKAVSAQAKAPLGSLYHHFPGGKDELVEDYVHTAGSAYLELVLGTLGSLNEEPSEALRRAFRVAGEELVASAYADACPIATVALEVASTNERLRVATADVFTDWIQAGTRWFARWIDDETTARSLAIGFVAALEGGFLLARAQRSTEPLDVAGSCVVAAFRAASHSTLPSS